MQGCTLQKKSKILQHAHNFRSMCTATPGVFNEVLCFSTHLQTSFGSCAHTARSCSPTPLHFWIACSISSLSEEYSCLFFCDPPASANQLPAVPRSSFQCMPPLHARSHACVATLRRLRSGARHDTSFAQSSCSKGGLHLSGGMSAVFVKSSWVPRSSPRRVNPSPLN